LGPHPTVLVVDDDGPLAEQLRWALKDRYEVSWAADRLDGLRALETVHPDLVLLDLCLPPEGTPEEGFRVLRAARARGDDVAVVVMSGVEDRQAALRAVDEGAYDFFSKPVDLASLEVVVARAIEKQALARENRRLRETLRESSRMDGIVGGSEALLRVFDAIRRVADSPVTVFLEGESGTGKELVARAIHFGGSRREEPFVAVHCAALPDTLLEAELFGHEKGAFTGAVASRVGRFEAANGGTLFLDEIACLNATTQIKLLRVLEQRAVERLGSNRSFPVDIRLIVASNEDLQARVDSGEFRKDLFFRVHVFPVRLPPLRERRDDILPLAEHFLRRTCEVGGRPAKRFSPAVRSALRSRDWPGNVRELMNMVEMLALVADGEVIEPSALPYEWQAGIGDPVLQRAREAGLRSAVDEFERRLLIEAIERAGGVKARAARELKLNPSQMKYLTRKHRL
jgi:DNA-binding NtrC family response regulator